MDQANFEKFIIDEEITSASNRWISYIDRFKNMLTAFKITQDDRKKALLLHYGGEQLFEIYKSFPSEEINQANFARMVDLLTSYFSPRKNLEYQVHLFRKIKQKTSESIDSFHSKLRKIALTCDFSDINREIKTQIIQNCVSQRLRRKALREDMTLSTLLAAGRALEMAEQHADDMEQKDSINKVTVQKEKSLIIKKEKNCFRCGGKYPHQNDCPAMGKKCSTCGKMNHFSKVCRTKNKLKIQEIAKAKLSDSTESSEDEFIFGI